MKREDELLMKGMKKLKLRASEYQLNQFLRYYELLIEANKKINLTTITEKKEVVIKHFLDSLLVADVYDLSKKQAMIDVGTGAGFPGIPLKIMFPELKVCLLDSLKKRLKFIDRVCIELGLGKIQIIHGRAEDIAHKEEYREQFDVCVSRAVANLSTLCEYCIPFVRIGGSFISYKSDGGVEEIKNAQNAIWQLGGELINTKTTELPCSDINRTFALIRKREHTEKKYPRKAGIPLKKPI